MIPCWVKNTRIFSHGTLGIAARAATAVTVVGRRSVAAPKGTGCIGTSYSAATVQRALAAVFIAKLWAVFVVFKIHV
jgi:hypothetical protein